MKIFGLLVVCLSLTIGALAFQSPDPLKAIVGSYLEIHALLIADKTEGVKPAAAAIAAKADGMGQKGAAIAKAARAVGAAPDLRTTRDAFGPLSDAVIAAAPADAVKDLGLKHAFCPMVNRSWLQKDDKIRNPYYGTSMLECGEIKK